MDLLEVSCEVYFQFVSLCLHVFCFIVKEERVDARRSPFFSFSPGGNTNSKSSQAKACIYARDHRKKGGRRRRRRGHGGEKGSSKNNTQQNKKCTTKLGNMNEFRLRQLGIPDFASPIHVYVSLSLFVKKHDISSSFVHSI